MLVMTATVPAQLHHVTWSPGKRDPEKTRLLAALCSAEHRLRGIATARGPSDAVVAACNECLRTAEMAAVDGAPYRAWDSLHQFDGEALEALDDKERDARWCSMYAEAEEKLGKKWRWRAAEAIRDLRDESESVPLPLLRELHSHLVTAAQNKQHKLEIFRKLFVRILAGALGASTLVAFAGSIVVLLTGPAQGPARTWAELFLYGIPAGVLGGALSMAFALRRADVAVAIPDLRLARLVMLTRPLVGGAVAIFMTIIAGSNVVHVAGLDGTSAVVAFCLAGGFSERLFLRVIRQFET